ncbi:MAG: hypothetical protein LBT21_07865 [Oscillospiraceae bacterium]|jgi:hypothetical protein|nr:hypothetical protein [Oscillospiraceae bacterium]
MKRIFVCLLAVLLLLAGLVFPASADAAPHDEASCTKVPIVFCEGAWHALYSNAGTPEQEEAWNTGGGGTDIVSDLQALLPEFPKYVRNEEWDKIADILADFANALLGPIRFNSDGESVADLNGDLNDSLEDLKQDHKGNPDAREYDFCYDWREDPWVLAERLRAYIEQVCEATGHSTVKVVAQSGSCTIFLSYLARYGTDRICSAVVRASLHNGSSIFGDIANKRLYLDADALAQTGFLRDFEVPNNEKILNMLQAANQAGLLKALLATINRAFPRIVDRLYEKAIVPTMLSLPMLWAYVPDEDYESSKTICFGEKRGQYVDLIRKLDRYHYNVAVKSDELLKAAAQKIRIGVYLGSNAPLFPAVKNSQKNSDGFVDTSFASLGATVAEPYGKKLGVVGVVFQKVKDGHKHISPDKTIDASTCLLPEQTWFVRNSAHIGGSNNDFAKWFLDSPKTQTVFSDPNYPQFLEKDEDDNFIPEVKASFLQQAGAALNPIARLKDLALGIVNFIITLGTWWID